MILRLFVLFLAFAYQSAFSIELTNKANPETNYLNERWEFISDQVMGGVSSGSMDIIKDDDNYFYRLKGSVSLENNGGFIQFRSKIKIKHDRFKGLEFVMRGNGASYAAHITTKYTFLPWQYYTHEILTTKSWETVRIYFEDFKKSHFYQPTVFNCKDIKTVGFVAIGKKFDAKLDIKDVRLF
tara:strand:- start:124 stop:672 length:549 start_codon:yes stop_codon:yes gene_type:complete